MKGERQSEVELLKSEIQQHKELHLQIEGDLKAERTAVAHLKNEGETLQARNKELNSQFIETQQQSGNKSGELSSLEALKARLEQKDQDNS